jgi:hypothetical protein
MSQLLFFLFQNCALLLVLIGCFGKEFAFHCQIFNIFDCDNTSTVTSPN